MARLLCAARSPALRAAVCAAFIIAPPPRAGAEGTAQDILFSRATAAYDSGRYDEAAALFRKVLALDPDDDDARRTLALSLAGAGKFEEGASGLRELLRSRPDDFAAGSELCLLLALSGRRGEAEGVLRGLSAEAGTPEGRAEVAFLRGVLAGEGGDYDAAFRLLDEAGAGSPAVLPRARYYRAAYLARSGRSDAAQRELAMLRERAPTAAIGEAAGADADALGRAPGRKRWGGRFTARYEYDDNVVLMPDNASLLDVTGQGDWRFMTTFELDAVPLTWGRFELDTRYSFVQSVHNRLGDFNLQGHVGDAYLRYNAPGFTPFLGYEYAYYFLDDCKQSYLRANRLIAGVDVPAASRAFYRLMYECAFDDFMLPYGPPADNWDTEPASIVSFEQYLFLGKAKKAFWRTGLRYDNNNARGDNFFFHGGALAGELYVPLPAGFAADLEAEYLVDWYTRNPDARRDQRLDLTAELRRNLYGEIDLVFAYDHIRNMSNVSLYQFTRNIYSLILEARF